MGVTHVTTEIKSISGHIQRFVKKCLRYRFAMVLAGLHLIFCASFFTAFFFSFSHDPNRGMLFILFFFVDPVTIPVYALVPLVAILLPTDGFLYFLNGFYIVSTVILGTAQWWTIGWLFGKIFSSIGKSRSK